MEGVYKVYTHHRHEMDDYFVGPIDLHQHSKWPIFLRLRGSVAPKMILPLLFIGGWATSITCISHFVYNLGINQVLLTVLGFVVALALSFRSTTAYERYNDGRKYWTQLLLSSQALARVVWIHVDEREGDLGKQDLLHKLTFINLICAFSVSLKHQLRFEPFAYYDDLQAMIGHLDLYSRRAVVPVNADRVPHPLEKLMMYLGIPMVEQNPRRLIKNPSRPLGNLPLELLSHMSAYSKYFFDSGALKTPAYQTQFMTYMQSMHDVLTGCDRVLNTPLPVAYSIAVSQITWVYVLSLPFQLYRTLGWVTIPATVIAAYVIFGIALIGREIENPFGQDVNDLPLDSFCQQIRQDLDVITSRPRPDPVEFANSPENKVMYPLSGMGFPGWQTCTVEEIREALRFRPNLALRKEFRLDTIDKEKTGLV